MSKRYLRQRTTTTNKYLAIIDTKDKHWITSYTFFDYKNSKKPNIKFKSAVYEEATNFYDLIKVGDLIESKEGFIFSVVDETSLKELVKSVKAGTTLIYRIWYKSYDETYKIAFVNKEVENA